jgi:mono/diheme cytochrome c family protein
MKRPALLLLAFAFMVTACSLPSPPGRPSPDSAVVPPDKILDFDFLYTTNCAGCHGVEGKGAASIGLGDPLYLAIADDATISRVTTNGVPGTSMPAFAQSAGGMLTPEQVHAIVTGIRSRWARPDIPGGEKPPPYSTQDRGDPMRGATVFANSCSSCHGAGGRGGPKASSVVDGSYLALVSDQNLRTTVIVGRPDLGAPDWRGDAAGTPLSPQDVTDVVSWLAAQRPEFPGQPYASAQRTGGGPR